jgi:hypothetical protein
MLSGADARSHVAADAGSVSRPDARTYSGPDARADSSTDACTKNIFVFLFFPVLVFSLK